MQIDKQPSLYLVEKRAIYAFSSSQQVSIETLTEFLTTHGEEALVSANIEAHVRTGEKKLQEERDKKARESVKEDAMLSLWAALTPAVLQDTHKLL